MDNRRKYVIPGDVITTGPYRPEQNVILEGNKIISTTIGVSEIYDDSAKVLKSLADIERRGRYRQRNAVG